ncbi:type VII secretion protein EccE [Streptomyces sp. NPDC057644]|uniref:type VII secretion protein EccE n=1 Tax=Streptomyces sp. NPDC057644 TaxID=3346191 RepID=UPI0036BA9EDC
MTNRLFDSLSRTRVVTFQMSAAALLAGIATEGPGSWILITLGVAVGLHPLLSPRDKQPNFWSLPRLWQGALTAADSRVADADLGMAAMLVPALQVRGTRLRDGEEVGVLADERGYAAALALPPNVVPRTDVDLLAHWLKRDAARPASVQLLVEQFGLPDAPRGFPPASAYRQLPARAHPLAMRSHIIVRYEPWDAAEVAAMRGGGARGARAALAAAVARLAAELARRGTPARALDSEQLRTLLRDTGDTDIEGRMTSDSWVGGHRAHYSVGVRLQGQNCWLHLLTALASADVDRTVAAATVARTATGTEARAAARLVSETGRRAAKGRDMLVTERHALPLPDAQPAGLVATLPLARSARLLEAATGFAPDTPHQPPTTTEAP